MEGVVNSLQSRRKYGKYQVKNVTKDGKTTEVSLIFSFKRKEHILFIMPLIMPLIIS